MHLLARLPSPDYERLMAPERVVNGLDLGFMGAPEQGGTQYGRALK